MPGNLVNSNQTNEDASKEIQSTSGSLPILIIDDDNWIHRIISHYLNTWGFTPISAMDAVEGLAKAIQIKPILILLDIIMPEVKGDTLLKMLKAIDITSDIPVLILSGNLNIDILSTTFKKGAVGYIAKPFTQETLFAKIRECLNPEIIKKLNIANFPE